MKDEHKKTLSIFLAGFVKIFKIIWIVIKSFLEAITFDFFKNIKKYWKKSFGKKDYVTVKKTEPKEDTVTPIP